jgi:hypothetical protein
MRPQIGEFLFGLGGLLFAWGVVRWFLPSSVDAEYIAHPVANVFYIVAGLILIWSGFMWAPVVRHDWAFNAGAFFVVLAGVGFAVAGRPAPNLWIAHMNNPIDNLVHLGFGITLILGGRRVLTEDVFRIPRRLSRFS